MKTIILGTATALALCVAGPALAQSTGSATIGGGVGIGLGGFSNGSVNTGTVNGSNSQSISGTIGNELSASSGSGFGGSMNINSLPGGTSYAVVGGVGEAGTSISSAVDPMGVGTIQSSSYNAGLFGGVTGGNAALNMQVMNFGQSMGDYKFNLTFAANAADTFNTSAASWDVAGAAGPSLFGFGSVGWNVQ
ncbi:MULTISPECIES: hypothetical protein [unclassified Sphingomonas]|uniref:hypothetical protein n=1 Tax=unclassified Sphingomonas TaxID=196159 RepID=UPI00226AA54C|nr:MULTISPECIES: hypothetical protein [unclassified Sphingomonas]